MTDHTFENQHPSFLAALCIAVLCISFGANAVAIKISLAGLGVFTTAGIRFTLASIAIFLWAVLTNRSMKLKKGQLHQVLIVSVMFTIQLGLFYMGLSKTYASRGALISNLQPFFVLILAHFFIPNDKITIKKIIGILLGFTGVAFMFLDQKELPSDFRTGDLMIFSAVSIWACNAVYLKRIIAEFKPFHMVIYPALFSIPFFFLAAYVWDDFIVKQVDLPILLSMFYQGFVTASFGFIAWNTMLQKYGAVALHSYLFLLPVTGVLLGGIFLGEPIASRNTILALSFIVSGIILVHSSITFFWWNR